jgi:hypothetical protein
MENPQQAAAEFGGRTMPPTIEAASRPGRGGDSDFPGRNPDEIEPQQPDFDQPNRSPEQEVPGKGGDIDQPGRGPDETPAQPREPGVDPAPD